MTLDQICQMTTSPDLLNALHACRENHPLNGPYQWRNAYSLAAHHKDMTLSAIHWLKVRANQEASK